ncbi:MAG: ankyrin repeat domain-containing protein [Bacteroidota bacterium]
MKTIRKSQILKLVLLLAMVTDCGSFTAGEESSHILATPCVTDGGMIAAGEKQGDHDFFDELVFLVRDPETVIEEVKDFLNEHTEKVRYNYTLLDGFAYTPIHYLAREGEKTLVQHLIESVKVNPDITYPPLNVTALQCAAVAGHLDVVKYLVCQGADVNHRDSQGNSVLFYAVTGGNIDVVLYLIGQDVSTKVEDNTEYKGLNLLHIAIIHNDEPFVLDLIELMQSKGIDVKTMAQKCTDLSDQATPFSLADERYGRDSKVSHKLIDITRSRVSSLFEKEGHRQNKRSRLINGKKC